ncbi:hypothetical protein JCM3770_004714 [Rhodotorula araucariae]
MAAMLQVAEFNRTAKFKSVVRVKDILGDKLSQLWFDPRFGLKLQPTVQLRRRTPRMNLPGGNAPPLADGSMQVQLVSDGQPGNFMLKHVKNPNEAGMLPWQPPTVVPDEQAPQLAGIDLSSWDETHPPHGLPAGGRNALSSTAYGGTSAAAGVGEPHQTYINSGPLHSFDAGPGAAFPGTAHGGMGTVPGQPHDGTAAGLAHSQWGDVHGEMAGGLCMNPAGNMDMASYGMESLHGSGDHQWPGETHPVQVNYTQVQQPTFASLHGVVMGNTGGEQDIEMGGLAHHAPALAGHGGDNQHNGGSLYYPAARTPTQRKMW